MRVGVFVTEEALGLPLPHYATRHSAGMDLRAAIPAGEPLLLLPGRRALVSTGLKLVIPEGYEGQVRARSGLALRYGIGLVNGPGTIDSDYRGILKVILINWGDEPFEIARGDRIAQLVISPIIQADLVEVEAGDLVDDLTERGTGGFGSTGR